MNIAMWLSEYRYVVIKVKDARAVLNEAEQRTLDRLADRVTAYRLGQGKGRLVCVVVESDWPEYEPTCRAIEKSISAHIKGGKE
jgi:hypothetical protein